MALINSDTLSINPEILTPYNLYSARARKPRFIVNGVLSNQYQMEFEIRKIISNKDATIIIFDDGSKTVVKKVKDEVDDKYKAVMYALLKSLGVTPKQVNKLVENIIVQENKK